MGRGLPNVKAKPKAKPKAKMKRNVRPKMKGKAKRKAKDQERIARVQGLLDTNEQTQKYRAGLMARLNEVRSDVRKVESETSGEWVKSALSLKLGLDFFEALSDNARAELVDKYILTLGLDFFEDLAKNTLYVDEGSPFVGKFNNIARSAKYITIACQMRLVGRDWGDWVDIPIC